MRKIAASVFLWGACLAAFGAEKPAADAGTPKNPLSVAEGAWAGRTAGGANAGWFLLGDGVVAVDAGRTTEDAAALLAAIKKTTGESVKYLILTSDFAPHAGGAPVFAKAGVTIVCQEKVANAVQSLLATASAASPAPGTHPASPMILTVSERMILSDGHRSAEINYPGPADSAGDLLVYVQPQKLLFAGDLAENLILPPLFSDNINPDGWIAVLNRLTKLKVSALVPGYGPIGSPEGLNGTGFYINETWEAAKRIAKEPTPEEFIPTRVKEADVARDLKLPDDLQPSHAANVTALVKRIRAKTPNPVPPAP